MRLAEIIIRVLEVVTQRIRRTAHVTFAHFSLVTINTIQNIKPIHKNGFNNKAANTKRIPDIPERNPSIFSPLFIYNTDKLLYSIPKYI